MIPPSLQTAFARHWPRVTLAVAWAIGGEVLAWSFPPDRPLIDWALILAGYAALAYAMIDLAVRWRMRDLYGVAALGGLAALVYALFMNPQATLTEIPRTLVTRALGAHGLILMGMLLLWLILLDVLPLKRLILPIAVVMGLCWGTWVRYGPLLTALRAPVIDVNTFSVIGVAIAAAIGLIAYAGTRVETVEPERLMLDPYEGAAVAAVLMALLYRQLDLAAVDMVARGLVVGLIGLCLAMMWFRKDSTRTFFHAPVRLRPPWALIAGSFLLFLIAGSVAFGAPVIGGEEFSQIDAVVLLFGFFGLAWMPGVAVILGLRAVLREVSADSL